MKNNTIANKQASVMSKPTIYLDYSLILTSRNECDLIEEDTVYSILILQVESGITTEYEFLYDIARDEKNAVEILNLLVYNNVMPKTAKDVITDYL